MTILKLLLRFALMLSSAIGIVWALCLYAFAFRASQILGHGSIPMINDPKLIPTDDALFHTLFGIVYGDAFDVAVATSILSVPCALYWYREHLLHQAFKISLGLYLTGLILCLTALVFDPGRCVEWVID